MKRMAGWNGETKFDRNSPDPRRKVMMSSNKFVLAVAAVASFAMISLSAAAQVKETEFDLVPVGKNLACLGVPNGPTPTAHVTVKRGLFNDTLTIEGANIKPHLAFDMFTVQRSSLLANRTPDPAFKNFGFAWYQSDLQASGLGKFKVTIKTILLDQIFGFDPDLSKKNFNTFNLGFWFNDPADAAACGFDVTKPTPFNGEHRAGPAAMISVPDAVTGLGPLCTNPNKLTTPATCNP
jgi:hypothetical protein